MTQREIGVRRLRADLANHVQRAGGGEGVVVTVNGRPMARLAPLATDPGREVEAGGEDVDGGDALESLAGNGQIRRPIQPGRRLVRPDPIVGRYPADVDAARVAREALGR